MRPLAGLSSHNLLTELMAGVTLLAMGLLTTCAAAAPDR